MLLQPLAGRAKETEQARPIQEGAAPQTRDNLVNGSPGT